MRFAEDDQNQGYIISAYDETSISVNGERHQTSIVIAPDTLQTDWPPASIGELGAGHFEIIASLEPELVLLGTGPELIFPGVDTYAILIERGIGVDVMNTGAACRTYNILLGEGRRVVAGIILPG